MAQILRAWLAFAALGAGILHLALVISSPLPFAVVLFVLGASELGWGIATLSLNRFVMPMTARAGAIAPVILWAALLLFAGLLDAPALASPLTFIPMAVATIFDLAIAATLSILVRHSSRAMPDDRATAGTAGVAGPAAWRYLGGLFAGGLAVSLLMNPALALTEAGLNNPHAVPGTSTSDFDPGVADHSGH